MNLLKKQKITLSTLQEHVFDYNTEKTHINVLFNVNLHGMIGK